MALDQNRRGVSAERKRGRVVLGTAGNDIFRLPHIRHDLGDRHARASGQTGERQRCAHGLEESAAREVVEPLRSPLGELAVQHLLKFFAARQLFEAAPVLGAGRLLELILHRRQIKLLALAGADVAHSSGGSDSRSGGFRVVLVDAHFKISSQLSAVSSQ